MKLSVKNVAAMSLVGALAIGACGKAASKHEESDYRFANNRPTVVDAATKESGNMAGEKLDGSLQSGLESGKAKDGRKVIHTGSVMLVVGTYDEARAKLDALLAQIHGYVDSTQVNRRQDAISDAVIVVRIPSDSFGSIMPKLREIGEIISESTNAADITDQYVDISARLATAKTLEKRLLELVTERNGNIDSLLAVERELARVRGEIEGYEGTMRQWNDQIAMSTLTISMSTKAPEIVAKAAPGLNERISHAFDASITSLRDFGSWLVINGIAFLPWLVLLIPSLLVGRRVLRRVKLPAMIARKAEPLAPPPPAATP